MVETKKKTNKQTVTRQEEQINWVVCLHNCTKKDLECELLSDIKKK